MNHKASSEAKKTKGAFSRTLNFFVGFPVWLVMCVVELIALLVAIISIPINIKFAYTVCEWAETLPDASWYWGKKTNAKNETEERSE